ASSAAGDFVFRYFVGSSSPRNELRGVTAAYTKAAQEAFRIFSSDQSFDGVSNLYTVNHSPNENVKVDPALYSALSVLQSHERKDHLLAPIFLQYRGVFGATTDEEAEVFDPALDPDAADYVRGLERFILNGAVRLVLLPDDTVRLEVDGEYLDFARREGLSAFVDLCWMKNAFVADYIADRVLAAGFSAGYLVSSDGFVRSLGEESLTTYRFVLKSRDGSVVGNAALIDAENVLSFVYLKDYTLANDRFDYYFQYSDGRTVTPFFDPSDCRPKCAVSDLAAASRTLSCGELAASCAGVYISELFLPEAEGVSFACAEGGRVIVTPGVMTVAELSDGFTQ
ncbi:MAG: hypothetical protein IJV00_08540, partial [Clostridia bacterium]|nr:hypothetical protein [Clostridia bacterium]